MKKSRGRYSSKNILDKIEEIRDELDNDSFLVNSYLRVSKAVPEQMEIYKSINKVTPRLVSLTFTFLNIFINLLFILISVILSLIFFYQYKYLNIDKSKKSILFVSHATISNLSHSKFDQFFANLPEYLNKNNLKCSLIYTNHGFFNFKKKINMLQSKSPKLERNLIPKFLKPLEIIEFVRVILFLSIRCYFLGIVNILKDPLKSVLLIECANNFFSRSTYSNYLVYKRLQDFVLKKDIHYLFLTLEGHSYEQFVISKLAKIKPDLKFVCYQHSPIVMDQSGITSFLKNLSLPILILTTSKTYKKYFSKISNFPRYLVFGSIKYIPRNKSVSKMKNCVLFAPEATYEATHQFLDLIKFLCINKVNKNLVLRLHPDLMRSFRIQYLIKKFSKFGNFRVSNASLIEDLMSADLVFFRSSAVGIQALQFNATPVFYSITKSTGVNSLIFNKKSYKIAKNRLDALKVIENHQKSNADTYNFSLDYYSQINYSKVLQKLKI